MLRVLSAPTGIRQDRKTARQQQWEAAHPDLTSLAEQVRRLSGEVERLRDLLRQHGIEPGDNAA